MIHLHGVFSACDCGAETGMTCVVFEEDYVTPEVCEICGKPSDQWGDGQPFRDELPSGAHTLGCVLHPDTVPCQACGEVIIDTMVFTEDGGPWHFREGCAPGVVTVDSETTL